MRIIFIVICLLCSPLLRAADWVDGFTGSVGAGGAVIPWFPGANNYRVLPLPMIDITYKQILFAAVNGVGAQMKYGNVLFGPRLVYNSGRYNGGHLKNMQDLAGSFDLGGFAKYIALPWVFSIDAQTAVSNQGHRGTYGNLGVAYRMVLDDYWTVIPSAKLMIANRNYMQAFFGVSDYEATRTGFKSYDADGGLYSAGATIAVANSYFDPWRFFASFGASTLGAQAYHSDVVQTRLQMSFFGGVAYHF